MTGFCMDERLLITGVLYKLDGTAGSLSTGVASLIGKHCLTPGHPLMRQRYLMRQHVVWCVTVD